MVKLNKLEVFCEDKKGLISLVTGVLYNSACNIVSLDFKIVDNQFTFLSTIEITDIELEDIATDIISELNDAGIDVVKIDYSEIEEVAVKNENLKSILIEGTDRPGLVTKITESFKDFDSNIIEMTTNTITKQNENHYTIQIKADIPEARQEACLSTISNVASSLGLNTIIS